MKRRGFVTIALVWVATFAGTLASPLATPKTPTGKPADTTGLISGQAFIKAADGTIRYADGDTIWLVPDDKASRSFMKSMPSVSPLAMDGVTNAMARAAEARWALGDREGRFAFSHAHSGTYIVVTSITWQEGPDRAGGVAWADVVIKKTGGASVIATGQYKKTQ